jgi:predicted DCC family thiol-disulfide oxidoreductase YuxK
MPSTLPPLHPGKTVEVFYDGDCPLCMREIRMLQRFDRKRARIQFTDIAAPTFSAAAYGSDQAAFMAAIKGRRADGAWIEGVEVFRQLYAAIGLGPLVLLTRLPGVSHLLQLGYHLFAKNRLRLTGRCAPGGACVLPTAPT